MHSVLNSNIFCGVWITFLSSVAAFSTYYLIKCKSSIERECKELKLHHRKHNCVVIYTGSTITGWPGFEGKYKISSKNIERVFEPICYFITTANKTLDIAVMILHSNILVDAIISALKKGVRVRLLLDDDYKDRGDLRSASRNGKYKFNAHYASCTYYKRCDSGAEIRSIRNTSDKRESLFHHKYAVKDYSDCEGYMLCGSSNWTVTSFTQNFEDLVFMSDHSVASVFHNNFEEMWRHQNELIKQ